MDRKQIKKRKMMSYFIFAARQVIEQKGIEAVNVRDVCDIAGYNVATLYNYFSDINDLIFYTSLGYMKYYIDDLNTYVMNSKNAMERFLNIWKCFCYHSFDKPRIFHAIFFEKYSHSLNHDIREYYSIFPEELGEQNEDLKAMLLGNNILERNSTILRACVNEGFIKEENLQTINEMIILLYQGMLARIISGQIEYSIEEASRRTLAYIRQIINSFQNE